MTPESPHPHRRPEERYRKRCVLMFGAMVAAFVLIFGRLWVLQVLEGEEYWRASTENIIQDVNISPPRGRIIDTHGVTLADNRPSFDVYLIPRLLRPTPRMSKAQRQQKRADRDQMVEHLTQFLNLTPAERDRVETSMGQVVAEVLVKRDVTRRQVAQIEAHSSAMVGVQVRPSAHRYYPFHQMGAHAIGFMGEVGALELDDLEGYGYRSGEYVGRMGLERAFEATLRGSPGMDRQVIDASGVPRGEEETRFLIGEYQHIAPIAGRDLVVTLDAELMLIAERAMAHKPAGAVVVLDPHTGSIKALYSKPGFDPNSWSGRLSSQEKLRNDSDPYKPMLDKTVNTYFPGSVFKIVGSLAALGEGLMLPEDETYCPGYYRFGGRRFRCWKHAGHGHADVVDALAGSCDVYYYKVAEQLGIDTVAKYAWMFGLGEATGLPINAESAGRVPTKAWHRQHSPEGYQYGFALNTIIGQGDTLASPLQIALAYAAIANGGQVHYPRLLERVQTRQGDTLFEMAPKVRKRLDIKPEHLEVIRRGLWRTINHPDGTAYPSRLSKVEVAGKTGTAQVHKIGQVRIANRDKALRFRDHAWFASYAPADNPELVIVVFLQHGGHGSEAAPVAMKIYDEYFGRDHSRPYVSRISELASRQPKPPSPGGDRPPEDASPAPTPQEPAP